jgi:hypothetical protein
VSFFTSNFVFETSDSSLFMSDFSSDWSWNISWSCCTFVG